jgi:hypothetical protein
MDPVTLSNDYHYNITELDFDTNYFAIQETNPGTLAIQLNPSYNILVSSFNAGQTGLTPDLNTVGSVTLGGVLNALHGGTGFDKYNTGDMLYSDRTDNLSKIAIGQEAQVLTVVNGLPQWKDSNASGTGSQLPATYQVGDILYANTTSSLVRRIIGTENSVLTVKNGLPVWQTGYVTKISGNVTGIFGNNLQNGNLVLSGTLYANSGGTGISVYSAGDMLMALTPNTLGKLAAGANGSLLSIVNGMPTWIRQTQNNVITGNNTGLTTIIQNNNLILNGVLYANSGGTGISNYNIGDIMFAINNNTLTRLGAVQGNGYVLTLINGLPSWQQTVNVINMANIGFTNINIGGNVNITGTLNSNSGGTGTTVIPKTGQILIGQPGGSYLPGNIVAGAGINVTLNNTQILISANNSPGAGGSTVVTTINNLIYLDSFGNQTLTNYVANTGGDIQVFGTGYQAGARLWFGNGNPYSFSASAKSVSSTTAVFTIAATNPGTYDVTLVNPDGSNAIRPRGLVVAIPAPVTPSYELSTSAYLSSAPNTLNTQITGTNNIGSQPMQISEGQPLYFYFSVKNITVPAGTLYYYTISGSGSLNASRFTDGTLTGTMEIIGNNGVTFLKELLANNSTDGPAVMIMTVYSDSARTKVVATSPVITILDTSLSTSPALTVSYYTANTSDYVTTVGTAFPPTPGIKVSGGTPPYTIVPTQTGLPPSVIAMTKVPTGTTAVVTQSSTSATWTLNGTPTVTLPAPAGQPRGTALYLTIKDSTGKTASSVLYFIVNPSNPLTVTPTGNQTFTQGTSSSVSLVNVTGGTPPYSYKLYINPGNVINGIGLGLIFNVNDATLSGTAISTQTATNFWVGVTDSTGKTLNSSTFTMTILGLPGTGTSSITSATLSTELVSTPNGNNVLGFAKYYTTNGTPSDAWVDMWLDIKFINTGKLQVSYMLYKAVSATSYASATKVGKVSAANSDQVISGAYYSGATNDSTGDAYIQISPGAMNSSTGGVFVPARQVSYYFVAMYDAGVTPTFNAAGAISPNTKVSNIITVDAKATNFYSPR